MPRETTAIHASGELLPLGAAMFIAIVVYPDDLRKRDKFVNACRAWIIKRVTGGQLKRRLVKNDDILYFSEKRRIDRQFNKAERILATKRLPALWTFRLQMMSKAITVNIDEQTKFSINRWMEKIDFYNPKNASTRVWSKSKPIIHLLMGLSNAIPPEKKPVCIEYLINEPGWLPNAIDEAENVRNTILAINGIEIDEDQQIKVIKK